MRNFKWAIGLTAVPQLDFVFRFGHILIVAPVTEIVRPIAEVDCYTATEKALPLDMLGAVLVAHGVADAVSFHLAVFAKEVVTCCRFFKPEIGCTVNHTSEVGLGASFTLVEAACVHSECK